MTNQQPALQTRKGALTKAKIPAEVMELLNQGIIASVNLTEWLAVDHLQLLGHVFKSQPHYLNKCRENLLKLTQNSVRNDTIEIGRTLLTESSKSQDLQLLPFLSQHASDSVRCWACYLIGLNQDLDLQEKLKAIQPFATDEHFGVREIAWMALRSDLTNHLPEGISILSEWAKSENENIRRFAVEAIRPRGVWCKHINALKEQPQLASVILEALKADPSPYVQLSVGNWLNDAGKTNSLWLTTLSDQWMEKSPGKATTQIIKKALRNLKH